MQHWAYPQNQQMPRNPEGTPWRVQPLRRGIKTNKLSVVAIDTLNGSESINARNPQGTPRQRPPLRRGIKTEPSARRWCTFRAAQNQQMPGRALRRHEAWTPWGLCPATQNQQMPGTRRVLRSKCRRSVGALRRTLFWVIDNEAITVPLRINKCPEGH